MSSTKRRQSVEFKPKPTPYKVKFTESSAGKTFSGTKRKMTWKFGWSDTQQEHEITLIHSFLSGKKTLLEDGRQVASVSTGFGTGFSHGWQFGEHVLRVSIDLKIDSDPEYEFTIDGARFDDFQDKIVAIVARAAAANTKEKSSSREDVKAAPVKKEVKAEALNKQPSTSFDPFSSPSIDADSTSFGGSSNDDAFGNSFGSAPSSTFDPFASDSSGPAPAAPAAFDAFEPSFGPSQAMNPPKPPASRTGAPVAVAAPNVFDLMDSAPISTNSSDPFADSIFSTPNPTSTSSSQAFDPFAPTSTAPISQDPFAPTSSPLTMSAPLQQASSTAAAPTKPADKWGGLVDLNLGGSGVTSGGRSNRPSQTDTLHNGPSLSVLAHDNSGNRRPSLGSGMGTMGGMGGQPSSMGAFGGGPMIGQQGGMGQPMMNRMGGGHPNPYMGSANSGNPSASGNSGNGINSLDNLIWK